MQNFGKENIQNPSGSTSELDPWISVIGVGASDLAFKSQLYILHLVNKDQDFSDPSFKKNPKQDTLVLMIDYTDTRQH